MRSLAAAGVVVSEKEPRNAGSRVLDQDRIGTVHTRKARHLAPQIGVARFLKNESGTTAIEYALIAGGISIVIVAAAQGIGTTLNTTFGSGQTALK